MAQFTWGQAYVLVASFVLAFATSMARQVYGRDRRFTWQRALSGSSFLGFIGVMMVMSVYEYGKASPLMLIALGGSFGLGPVAATGVMMKGVRAALLVFLGGHDFSGGLPVPPGKGRDEGENGGAKVAGKAGGA